MLPKGLGQLGDMAGMLKQAVQLKSKMEEIKNSLGDHTVEATAGGGMVTVVINGKYELVSLKIDPDVLSENDPEMLETLIKAAVNEGIRNAHEMVKEKMQELTGGLGLNIPGFTD